MTVRAKFRVTNSAAFTDASGKPNGHKVTLTPVYDSNPESENGRFYRDTPWGEITMGTVNPDVAHAFVPGSEFYVDFTPTVVA